MQDHLDGFKSVVAKSNLVATAGEFVPRNLGNHLLGIDEKASASSQNNPNNIPQQTSTLFYGIDNISIVSDDGQSRPAKPHYNSLDSENRESSSYNVYPSTSAHGKSPVFYPRKREHKKFFTYVKANTNDQWDRPNLSDHGCNIAGLNEKKSAKYFESDYEKKYFSQARSKQIVKYQENNHGKFFAMKDSTSVGSDSSDIQSKISSNCNETKSWRKKNNFLKGDGQQQSFSNFKYKHDRQSDKTAYKTAILTNLCQTRTEYSFNGHHQLKGICIQYLNFKSNRPEDVQEKNVDININSVSSQREQLIDMLTSGTLECLVCCEVIKQNCSVWNCCNCYHVIHLKCIIKWAKSSKGDFGWRCPACQNVTDKIPNEYYCFCGKLKNPEWNHQDCPHSCGELCGKTYRKVCAHKCTLLCHPGPCPPCTAIITKSCGCSKTKKITQCCSPEEVICEGLCLKKLNCLIHLCSKTCHFGECGECNQIINQDCFCQKSHREAKCTIETVDVKNFSCGDICKKPLSCKKHFCHLICHEGECPKCELAPEFTKFCPCGQTELAVLKSDERKYCTDPIPTCELICGKTLLCGNSGRWHTCKEKCHEGPCPECPLETVIKCRCGHMDRMVPCRELSSQVGAVFCDRRCTKKRSCGKHKCNQLCCTGVDHECPLPCNRNLQCGLHRCEDTCHRGHCKPCLRATFDELSCECGAEIIFPPVPCGTRRPSCERPCTRSHACGHPPVHNCHSANQCPPCTVLTKKYCHGRHELRKAVPCHQVSFSCGLPCGKKLECDKHKCIIPCHSGPCLKRDQFCTQPCNIPRATCGHICGAPCHEGPCPTDLPCKEMVRATCDCGHRFTTRGCHDNAKEFQRIATAKLATKMADLRSGQSIDLNDSVTINKKLTYKTLECNDECKLIERNRRLAIALQIRNPDLSAKLTPRFSDYLKNWAKRDPKFCQMVHDKLTDLVQLAKQSKQKSRSYSFESMNREKRHFIHEYCEHFGCESVAYDQEPKRNVVATALKDKCWLPGMSITEFVQKENSPRKVPVPIITKNISGTPQRGMEVLNRKNVTATQLTPSTGASTEPHVDYFDWQPPNPREGN